ncbi:MAG: class I SAM-dependent DNA methyltransferase [Bacillota bacterium]|uniref:Class I SAM-dependent methyltransferase n=1 Tax=Virgibacillus salarius TaxID=447199 RepID=A0A941DXU5_9BACI|nr:MULTISPECIES: class I SAM-dependent methyltransferase [Bacillaceae]NAZ10017.1 methyltransferase domain-containing protein [Agaribacter marinus]MBR7797307.1 class I SAM-dependent methyltransferase [Virgibacillus salarius]MCC2250227.1 class I SAM-dependent methyltransferase [Virgibacillus sp. AGTR]MDY7044592.1 class I SAM-dependent methyltransferase [Virgibacillus sp. M23]QRZ17477.1 class I SAM-dependent methyltransferase [Virgibacillus sp. AGTR]
MAYEKMANVYDLLMEDAPYDQWVAFTEAQFKSRQREVGTIADLGCGTGEIAIRLAKKGYQVTGVDYAADMLTYAAHKSATENMSIQWICQDLRSLVGLQGLDAIVSYCDVINYITSEASLRDTFININEALDPGGLFLFDVHALSYITDNYFGETFADVTEDASYIWFCAEGTQPGEMFHQLTFFVRDKDNLYHRFEEEHHQRTFPVEIYKKILNESGFENIKVYGDFSLKADSLNNNTARIFFSAEKKPE